MICRAFEQRPKVILQAPTGSGKSLIAAAIHKLISRKTFICVSTKQLQDQYLKDFKFARTVKGRSNFRCVIDESLSANECQYELGHGSSKKCPSYGSCPYFVQRNEALEAELVIHNYAYALRALNFTRVWGCADLLVLDEADTAESHLIDIVAPKFRDTDFDFAGVDFPTSEEPQIVLDSLKAAHENVSARCDTLREEFLNRGELPAHRVKEFERLDSLRGKIGNVLVNASSSWLVVFKKGKHHTVELRPVWVTAYTHYLFNHGKKILLMSGTIGDHNNFARLIGIEPLGYHYFELPSTFPIENRPFIVKPIANMAHKNIEESLPKMLAFIDEFVREHKAEKGIIHTGNYRITRYILTHTRLPRYWFVSHEGAGEREEALDAFVYGEPPKVLVSPSFDRGADFAYDLCRWQLVVKIPYPDLTDKIVKRRLEENPDWYRQVTASRTAQCYGRGVRAADDRAVTVMTDAGYQWFYRNAQHLMPEWFKEAHVWEQD